MKRVISTILFCVLLVGVVGVVASAKDLGDKYYKELPFTNILPLPKGPVAIDGKVRPIRIGFSQTAFNHPWRVAMIEAAKAEAARHSNVQLVITDGNVDVMKQTADVQDLLAQGVDAIVLSPIESTALVPAAKQVMAAGIPLVVLDRDVFTNKTLFIGQDNYKIAYQLGKLLGQQLKGQGNVVEISGILGSSVAIDRHNGFADALKEYPKIKILQMGDGQFLRDPAMKLMEDWLTRYPKIDAVYSHAEESAWGAALAIRRAGREKDGILQFTIDASNEGFRSVQKGEFAADGNYTPFIGDVGVRAALYALMGKAIPKQQSYQYGHRLELPELPVVTKNNVSTWLGKGWGN